MIQHSLETLWSTLGTIPAATVHRMERIRMGQKFSRGKQKSIPFVTFMADKKHLSSHEQLDIMAFLEILKPAIKQFCLGIMDMPTLCDPRLAIGIDLLSSGRLKMSIGGQSIGSGGSEWPYSQLVQRLAVLDTHLVRLPKTQGTMWGIDVNSKIRLPGATPEAALFTYYAMRLGPNLDKSGTGKILPEISAIVDHKTTTTKFHLLLDTLS